MTDFRLKVFMNVCKHLSFTKAAHELYISQPAISKHIRELEQTYNCQLFERMGNQIKLTNEGRILLFHTQNILDQYEALSYEINQKKAIVGTLPIGASTTIGQYVLPEYLAEFKKKNPEVKVHLLNGNTQDIEQELRDRKIDIGFIEGASRQPTFHYTPWIKDELVAIVSSNSKLAHLNEISLDQLSKIPLVCREQGSGTLEVFELALQQNHLKLQDLNIQMQLGSSESIKLYLKKTDSIAIISIQAIKEELFEGKFKLIEIPQLKMERTFCMVQLQGMQGGIAGKFRDSIQNQK